DCFPVYDRSIAILSGVFTGSVDEERTYDHCPSIEVRNSDVLAFRGPQCPTATHFAVESKDTSSNGNIRRRIDIKYIFQTLENAALITKSIFYLFQDISHWADRKSAPYIWTYSGSSTLLAAELQRIMVQTLSALNALSVAALMVTVQPTDSNATDPTNSRLGAADFGMIFLLALVLLIIIASTSYDVIIQRASVWKHKRDTNTDYGRFAFCLQLDQNVSMMIIYNASLATDTFLLLSGTLLADSFMRGWDKKTSFNIATFYIHRYLRLTPPYAFLIFFYATLLSHLGCGPLWQQWVGRNRDYCLANWWSNLLYINNYMNVPEMCLDQTWYLAVDMQLFWFSPLVLYPLAKSPRLGKGLLAFVFFISLVIPFAITYAEKLTALMIYTKEISAINAVYEHIYTRTYARAGPYFIGIALGYLLHTLKNKHISISMVWVALGWLVSLCSCAAVVFGGVVFYSDNHEYNAFESSMYAGLHRSAWALSVAWIVFACVTGYGGLVDLFLSWKLFVPLSRLTYCTYLCQYVVLLINIGSTRVPAYLSGYTVVHEFAGNLLFILVLAAAISLAFEMPFMNLDRILIKRQPH
ncbi:hypothetical protein Cfor_02684, partial [Coptotermes formosanus]